MLRNEGGVKRGLDLNAEKRIMLPERHKCNLGSSGSEGRVRGSGKKDEAGERAGVAWRAGKKTVMQLLCDISHMYTDTKVGQAG
jgi:hypothetical protein